MRNPNGYKLVKTLILSCLTISALSFGDVNKVVLKPSANPALTPMLAPPSPDIDAKGFVLMDADSGRIIAEKNGDLKQPPASLTKLMTLYVISNAIKSGQIDINDKARVSEMAWKTGGSRLFLKVGTSVPITTLIEGIIVASGNDACVTMAQFVAGTEDAFANLMNQSAQSIGMHNSHFTDSTGLPHPDHFSTPHDLAILAQTIINKFPEDYHWYKQKWIKYNGIKQPNRNRLLWRDNSVDGLKTGHTSSAGFCLISSAKRGNMRLISVVMGAPSDAKRASDSQALINWGFRFYETHKLFNANIPVEKLRVWLGKDKFVDLGLSNDLYITIPKSQYANLKAVVETTNKVTAPVIKNQAYGKVNILLNDKVIATKPLIALSDDPKGGIFVRIRDNILKLVSKNNA